MIRNPHLIDIPYNILRLEIFDFALIVAFSTVPMFFLSIFVHPMIGIGAFPVLGLGLGIFLRVLKRDKRFGYTQRLLMKTADTLMEKLGDKKVYFP